MTKALDIEKKFYEDFVNDKANAFKNAFMSCYDHVQELLKIRNTRTYLGIYSCIEEGENLWKAFCRKINSKYPGAVFENGFEEAIKVGNPTMYDIFQEEKRLKVQGRTLAETKKILDEWSSRNGQIQEKEDANV